jgi:CHAT domain-containing protein
MLLVTMPQTPGRQPLPAVSDEAAKITELLESACTTVSGKRASTHTVQALLSNHAWAHFGCHANSNLEHPSESGLELNDGVLTVSQLIRSVENHAEFAFLSACDTATGSVRNPDELITLASAFHFAGWRHVIGTMWAVRDYPAAQIVEDTYQALVHDGRLDPTHAAKALHFAMRSLRASHLDRPGAWAPFMHVGP